MEDALLTGRKPIEISLTGPAGRLGLALCLLFSVYYPLYSQLRYQEKGYYPIENYDHESYKAHHQNWFITQDRAGFVYSANGQGVLEFDGASWRLISAPGLSAVRTVVVDTDNVKWVGADRELGYLEPDSLGFLQYISLKSLVPESDPLVGNIWQIFPEGNRILFVTDRLIYCWEDGAFRMIPTPGNIYREYQIHGRVYFQITGKGMYELVGDSLELIPGGEDFRDRRAITAMPYGDASVLFTTRESGMFVYDGNTIGKLENEVEQYLFDNNYYANYRVNDSTYAFATLRGGVALMNGHGDWLGAITEDQGILNNQVHCLAIDNEKAMWAATQTGISRVSLQLPYQLFDQRSGLEGTVSSIVRHKDTLYVGTYYGLFSLVPGEGVAPARFRKIEDIHGGCHALLSTGGDLLAATSDGVFAIKGLEVQTIYPLAGCRALRQSKRDPNRVFVGHMHGLSSLYLSDSHWRPEKDLEQLKDDIFSITSDASGTLWLGTSLNKAIEVNIPLKQGVAADPDFGQVQVTDHARGLPTGNATVFLIEGKVYVVTTAKGGPLFVFDKGKQSFVPEARFGSRFGLDSLLVYPAALQDDGAYLLLESLPVAGKVYRFSARKTTHGDYAVERIYDEAARSTTQTSLYWDEDRLLWLGGEQMVKYQMGHGYDFHRPFATNIRRVSVGQDSSVYGGAFMPGSIPEFPFRNGGLRFAYAATSLTNPHANRYQYRLQGFEDEWSDWTLETHKDYTNLSEGSYRFMVRAQNLYGDISESTSFGFDILPPWYRSWGAYLLYVFLFLLLLWLLIQWRSRQLMARNEELERVVAMRTAEVQHQANQLRVQAEKLQVLDKAKSRFFANISHEFRTPLTLIKGPIEHLEEHSEEHLGIDTVKMIRRNANRLLQLVNQLLDLSKIDEGSLKLSPTEGDVFKCLRAATSSFNSHAAQRNIDYRVQIPQGTLWASFDRDKLENVIYNLLGNAFKFSKDGASISFLATFLDASLQVLVADNGKGIPEADLPYIFDRFYQVDSSTTRDKQGSGIGLSLSRDLVELMGGTIAVNSEVGKGTRFKVRLPVEEIRTKSPKEAQAPVPTPPIAPKKTLTRSKADQRKLPRILLVEDNADMRHFIKDQLLPHYRVSEAVNGEIGLQMAMKLPPDLLITDLMMPRMDGIELCRQLKTHLHTSHVPVIVLTAKAGRENKIEGLETGADDYLTKPFDGKELLVRIKNLIEQRRQLRALYSRKDRSIDPKEITVTSIDQRFLGQLLELLEVEHPNPDFGVPQMQKALAMSKTQLHRKLKALTNEAPGELLRNFRLKRAAQLLRQKDDSVTQIAYKVGFNNLSYFAKCFKELFGQSPSNY